MIETQFETKIKTMRPDNGGEFDLKQFYIQKGIIHPKTCVETPKQNAFVERKHQHIKCGQSSEISKWNTI